MNTGSAQKHVENQIFEQSGLMAHLSQWHVLKRRYRSIAVLIIYKLPG